MASFEQFQFMDEEGRQEMYKWSERRRKKYKGFGRFLYFMKIFALDRNLLKSFIHNVNIMVLVQMGLAGMITFLCSYANLFFEVHVTLFVSPLVFPLAFSINTDFQRREKVLEDLANFKASIMVWFFCIRDWRTSAGFSESFMKAASNKAKGLMFHLREYLLSEKSYQRNFILRILYEDLSDVGQINDKIRTSKMESSSPILARIIHIHYLMCLSFERLRVIREYRSPRSIRSFTKVFIFFLPLLLAPYYVYLGRKLKNNWSPYFIAVLVTFLFGALQGVQDKLDDPFDGMSEDDIDLETLDEWTVQSLEATANRTTRVGRFTVSVTGKGKVEYTEPTVLERKTGLKKDESFAVNRSNSRKKLGLLPWQRQLSQLYSDEDPSMDTDDFKEMHPYKDMLSNLPGNATIVRGGHVKEKRDFEELNSSTNSSVNPVLDPAFYQLHSPLSSVQRSVDSEHSATAARKAQLTKVLFDREKNSGTVEVLLDNDKTDGYPQRFDVPNTFQDLFRPETGQAGILRQSESPQVSVPTTIFMPFDGQGSRRWNAANARSESTGMIAHPGIGVASYINAMNKDKHRKISAPSLRGSLEQKSSETVETLMPSDDSLDLTLEQKDSLQSVIPQKKFQLQKAKAVTLPAITPNVKNDMTDRNSPKTEEPEASDESQSNIVPEGRVVGEKKKFTIRSASKTKLLDNEVVDEERQKQGPSNIAESMVQQKKIKFSIKKCDSDSKLMLMETDASSDGSLSNVVGKLKDDEVFL